MRCSTHGMENRYTGGGVLYMLCIFYCFSILLGVVIHLDPGRLNFVRYGMTIHCHMRMTM